MIKVGNIKKYLFSAFIIILALLLNVIPFYNLIINGIYTWHVTTLPEVYEGWLEIVSVAIIIYILWRIFPKRNYICVSLVALLYLSMNAVIVPAIVAYLFYEGLCYIGHTVSYKAKENETDLVQNFISGCVLYGSVAVVQSLLKFGTINDLRISYIFILGICLCISSKSKYELYIVKYLKYIKNNPESSKVFSLQNIYVISIILVLLAKTCMALETDSLWTSLYPEKYLIGANSFYDYLGMVSHGYYYPKLMELLYLPVSDLGATAFILCLSVIEFALVLYEIYQLVKLLCLKKHNESCYFTIVLIFASIPAIADVAATAKSYTMGALFVTFALRKYFEWRKDNKMSHLIYGMLALLMSTGVKFAYFLWGGLLFVFILIFGVAGLRKGSIKLFVNDLKKIKIREWISVSCGFIFVIGVHYRTYLLTGYWIFYRGLIAFWQRHGIGSKIYFSDSNVSIADATIAAESIGAGKQQYTLIDNILNSRLYQVIFDPTALPKYVMLWTTNILLFLFVLWLFYINRQIFKNKNLLNMTLMAVLYILIMLYYFLFAGLSDANYFIFPYIVAGIAMFCTIIESDVILVKWRARLFYGTICIFLFFNAFYVFLMHPSWHNGTRKWDNIVVKNNFTQELNIESIMDVNGISKINEYLKKEFEGEKILTSGIERGCVHQFAVAAEPVEWYERAIVNSAAGNLNITYQQWLDIINSTQTSGFVIGNEYDMRIYEFIEQLKSEVGVKHIVQDKNAVFYDFSHFTGANKNLRETSVIEGEYYLDGWVDKYLNAMINTANGRLFISGYVPSYCAGVTFAVKLGDNIILQEELPEGEFKFNVETQFDNRIANLELFTNKSFVPADIEGGTNDNRELSIIINDLHFE